jgi:hypothetical protein
LGSFVTQQSGESNESTRDQCGAAYVLVVLGWLLGTAVLDGLFLAILDHPDKWERWAEDGFELIGEGVAEPIAWMWYVMTIFMTSPFLARAVQTIRRPWLIAEIRRDDLAGLSPGLRGLVTDARVLRVVLESRDDSALLEVWNWQRRFEQLGDADRREIEHLGLGEPGIAELLRWTGATPGQARRGMTEITRALEQFEQRLLDSPSLFRGPFR